MSTNPNVPGGNNGATGGQTETPNGTDGTNTPPQTVAYETYSKTVDEVKSLKAKLKEFDDRIKAVDLEKSQAEREKLEKQGNYEGLLKAERDEAQRLKDELAKKDNDLKALNQDIIDRRKLARLTQILGTNVVKYEGLISYDDIHVNSTTGDIDEISLNRYAESFGQTFPEVVVPGRTGMPNEQTGGKGGTAKITYSEYMKLSVADMKKWAKTPELIIKE